MGVVSAEQSPIPHEQPVTVTEAARTQLGEWGLTDEQIGGVISIAGNYDYANVPQRIAQIHEVYFSEEDGRQSVVIPSYPPQIGPVFSGDCNDIVGQMALDIPRSDSMRSLGENPLTRDIHFAIVYGTSRTHFARALHAWGAFMQDSNADGHVGFSDASKMVNIDGSFREVATLSESGYIVSDFQPSRELRKKDFPLSRYKHRSLRVHTLAQYDESGITEADFLSFDYLTLGISESRRFIYAIFFAQGGDVIMPGLRIGHENSIDDMFIFYDKLRRSVNVASNNDDSFAFTQQEASEIDNIVVALDQIAVKPMPSGFDISEKIVTNL